MLRLMKEKEQISVINDQTGCPTYVAARVVFLVESADQRADVRFQKARAERNQRLNLLMGSLGISAQLIQHSSHKQGRRRGTEGQVLRSCMSTGRSEVAPSLVVIEYVRSQDLTPISHASAVDANQE